MNNGEKRKVSLESTIFGYLTGRPSAIPKTAYWQALTRQWWENCLPKVDCFVSRWVISESEDGDAVERRKVALKDFPEIRPAADKVAALAQKLIETHALPENEVADAFHIATGDRWRHGLSAYLELQALSQLCCLAQDVCCAYRGWIQVSRHNHARKVSGGMSR